MRQNGGKFTLVSPETKAKAHHPGINSLRVAILTLPKSDLFDIVGPFEAFARAGQIIQQQRSLASPFYAVDLLTIREHTVSTWLGLQLSDCKLFSSYQERRTPLS